MKQPEQRDVQRRARKCDDESRGLTEGLPREQLQSANERDHRGADPECQRRGSVRVGRIRGGSRSERKRLYHSQRQDRADGAACRDPDGAECGAERGPCEHGLCHRAARRQGNGRRRAAFEPIELHAELAGIRRARYDRRRTRDDEDQAGPARARRDVDLHLLELVARRPARGADSVDVDFHARLWERRGSSAANADDAGPRHPPVEARQIQLGIASRPREGAAVGGSFGGVESGHVPREVAVHLQRERGMQHERESGGRRRGSGADRRNGHRTAERADHGGVTPLRAAPAPPLRSRPPSGRDAEAARTPRRRRGRPRDTRPGARRRRPAGG